MYNKTLLIGRLGSDPEFKTVGDDTALAKFTLATTNKFKDVEETEWHRVIVWRRLAEVARDYLKKGSLVHVEGRIHYDSYENKDGQKVYTTEIVCDNFKMLGGKGEKSAPKPAPAANDSFPNDGTGDFPEPYDGDDDDDLLPF